MGRPQQTFCMGAALRHLGDDKSRLKVRIVPIGKNTDLEIRVAQSDSRCLVIQPYNDGDRCLWRS